MTVDERYKELYGDSPFSPVEEAIEEIQAGRMVVVVDSPDRENEGDLVMAADVVTADAVNFMAMHARGLICLTLTPERCEELGLPMMTQRNRTPYETAFTVSIEARNGVSTGISAADRAHTIRVAVDPNARAEDLIQPGHVFPLRARPHGVLERTGQTEASVDLARMAGFSPAGVICEVMNDDGTMARIPDLVDYCQTHGLKMITVADLIAYRHRREKLVERIASARMPTRYAQRIARQQLSKFFLRHGRAWSGTTSWTSAHWLWIGHQEFNEEGLRRVRDDYVTAIVQATARIDRLTRDIEELVEHWAMGPLVKAFQALRGVRLVTATVLAAEIGDFARFRSPRQLMAYLGLVPSEHSSGKSRRQGGITRTGNRHARWILIEAAWSYRLRPKNSRTIEARRRQVAVGVRSIAEKAEQRLHRRYWRLTNRGKKSQEAVTAVARELVGFVWAIAREDKLLAA